MSMPMSNVDKGGYVPAGFGAGYPSGGPAPNMPQGEAYGPSAPGAYGFTPGPPQGGGYAPVPQMPAYGEVPPNIGGPQPPYGGMAQPQPLYNGGGGFQPSPGFGPQGPVVTQPGMPPPGQPGQPMMQPPQAKGPAGDWMSMPAGIPNCPRGLEYLTMVDQLLVKQKVELLEAFTGFETNNKFSIKNALGQKVYFAVEDSDSCTRNICGSSRPFDMKVFDNCRNEVIHMNRPLACSACCFPCCLQTMEVSSPPGCVVGTIEQEWSLCSPSFRIKNHSGDTMLRIEGPFCTFSMCGDVQFNIVSLTGESVGKIVKQWSGLAQELFTDADFFGITFPLDLDVRIKAVLLGATFLIDAMFFEGEGN
ncbi:phospholipid scramblase 2-like [Anastrepha obliqua]|uniref:phospholipid scramblase 2-like n=1 Tax=Anastrepha obliqua TaxID=95512 RepID=UPI0024093E08|nr:phospholipid scramblase 2-like [Anastrepha obliqua]